MRKAAILISIRPEWCAMIANEKKTIEVRKTRPKSETPFKAYIYCTNCGSPLVFGDVFRGNWEEEYVQTYGWSRKEADRIWGVLNGKVIGEFVCDGIEAHDLPYPAYQSEVPSALLKNACLSYTDLHQYVGSGGRFYGWHISDLVIYDEPKQISDFWKLPCERKNDCGNCLEFDRENLACMRPPVVTRPPQSWCYVQEADT